MIRPKLSLRRPLAALGATLVGVAAATAFAAPASAHHSIITGTACKLESGDLAVTWTVKNSERDLVGKITDVWTPSATEITGIAPGVELPKAGDGVVTGQQVVKAGKKAELKISAEWFRGDKRVTNTAAGSARTTGKCAPAPTPEPTTPEPTDSPEPTETPAPTESPEPTETPAPTEEPTSPAPSESPSEEPTSPAPTDEPTSPAPTSPVPTPQPTEPGGPLVPDEPNAPVFEVIFACDALAVTADNPADGVTATIVFTTDKGVTKELKLIPGEKTEVVFEAYEGLTITPSFPGEQPDPADALEWEKPAECAPGAGGGEGGLPLTGAPAGMIAGGAAVLLAVGAGLFMMARRRRNIRFTA
ncbi:hypothetical protein K7640_03430 [Micromonospora sp. PLK6-60]|uniref:hypothetical protein n=1 Tax=Micromonospora sp. PLK6-60 TaxID=2873383 RepID=UPI001CA757D2|nr:hypothetical protein [Micromonospora sp. PLK6-60]MBY8870893.1 hypothetical protein [Micromonospora sp. PLK6-60]